VISGLAAAFLLVQLAVPLAVIASRSGTDRDFAWDMFSSQLRCEKLDALVKPQGKLWGSLRWDVDFSSWAQLRRVLSPARFERYAQRLCQALRAEHGSPVELYVQSECRNDRDQAPFAILDPHRDFCSQP
jgi:hypothetical protein